MVQTTVGKCPLCGKAPIEKTKPFCSSRCATLDLGRWLSEGYAVPVEDNSDEMDSLSVSDANEEN